MTYPMEHGRSSRVGAGLLVIMLILTIIALMAYGRLNIKQTQSAQLPDVTVQGGQTSHHDLRTANVELRCKRVDVSVPKKGSIV